MTVSSDPWWRSAVVYQVYPRSFADGSGDGVGDLAGLRERLPYLAALGVDAIWINPWYVSPQADGGYDVADYRAIDPDFGTLAEAETLITEAHGLGVKIILDIVPNHTSDQHPWFRAALAAAPGSAERGRYVFRPGRGRGGAEPPTNWRSSFSGSAWTRVTEPDGTPGEWYLHLFTPEQPDLNWQDPGVVQEFEEILRFWFDRGVDGFRIDVAHGLVKDQQFPDLPADLEPTTAPPYEHRHPAWDQDGVHEIYRRWRRLCDSYAEPRILISEAWVFDPERLARYTRADELHQTFNFNFLMAPWEAAAMRKIIDDTLRAFAAVGAPATWVLSNHDMIRHLTRYGRPPGQELAQVGTVPVDLELGTRRARAAALLLLALPGGAYVYQGDELGLWEIEDIPNERLRDPIWQRSGHQRRGRDGCRVPLPWSGSEPPFGFSSGDPWLPQPQSWRSLTAEAQTGDPASMLTLYREALRLRRDHPALGDGTLTWLPAPPDVLAFSRDPGFTCILNQSSDPIDLPSHTDLLLSSSPLPNATTLPPDHAAWLRTS
ncbi:glycoside hydrolase family 13 protein [Microlunatus speluncae]|uniref:glycoside hydrolase family 13 protein n=1 Tax=Microlunatus speluncae TaxID=2594267 RepID=UPI001266788A|nr:alpha-amylase family glycosyl hydrolase [Microlunatus speluncae]